jgi:hypothetical protein
MLCLLSLLVLVGHGAIGELSTEGNSGHGARDGCTCTGCLSRSGGILGAPPRQYSAAQAQALQLPSVQQSAAQHLAMQETCCSAVQGGGGFHSAAQHRPMRETYGSTTQRSKGQQRVTQHSAGDGGVTQDSVGQCTTERQCKAMQHSTRRASVCIVQSGGSVGQWRAIQHRTLHDRSL